MKQSIRIQAPLYGVLVEFFYQILLLLNNQSKDFPNGTVVPDNLRKSLQSLLGKLHDANFELELASLHADQSSRSHILNEKIDLINKLKENGIINFVNKI